MQRVSAACKALVLAHLVLVPVAAEVSDAVQLIQNTASVSDSPANQPAPSTHSAAHHSKATAAHSTAHHSEVPSTHSTAHHSTATAAHSAVHHSAAHHSAAHHSTATAAHSAAHHSGAPATHSTPHHSLSHSHAHSAASMHHESAPVVKIMSAEQFSKLSEADQLKYVLRKKAELEGIQKANGALDEKLVHSGHRPSSSHSSESHQSVPVPDAPPSSHSSEPHHSVADTLAHSATGQHHSPAAFPKLPKFPLPSFNTHTAFRNLQAEAKHVYEMTKDKRSQMQKVKHSGVRQRAAVHTAVMTASQRAANELQGNLESFGEPMALNVRVPSGEMIRVNFRKEARLQFLKAVICKKLDLKVNHTHFSYKGDEVEDNLTPSVYGMTEQDVIDLDSFQLQERAQREVNAAHKAVIRSKLSTVAERARREGKDEEAVQEKVAQARKQALLEEKKAIKAENELNDKIMLKFKNPLKGGKDVRVSVKKDLPLESAFDLVVKKMGLFGVACSYHYGPGFRLPIKPSDNPAKLKLQDETTILVRGPAEKTVISTVHKGEAKKTKRKELVHKLTHPQPLPLPLKLKH